MKFVYPEVDSEAPFDDRRLELMDWGWSDYSRRGGVLGQEAYIAEAKRVFAEPTEERLKRLLLLPATQDRTRQSVGDWVPTSVMCASMAADLQPDIGADMPDLLFGDLADGGLPRPLLRLAMAEGCFARTHGMVRCPFKRWCRAEPIPKPAERAVIRTLAVAPLGVWAVHRIAGDRAEVTDRLGLTVGTPPSEVRLVDVHSLPGSEEVDPVLLVARVLPDTEGWRTAWGITVGHDVDQALLERWVGDLWMAERLVDRKASRVMTMSWRGFVVARRVFSRVGR